MGTDAPPVRRRILEAAFDAFLARGVSATSIHDLKRDTGISGGALAHHFPAKRDLILAVLAEPVAAALMETWIAPLERAADTRTGVAAIFQGLIADLSARGRVLGCPLHTLASEIAGQDARYADNIRNLYERWRQVLTRKIEADQASGRLPPSPADELALFIIATYSGAMGLARSVQQVEPLAVCAATLDGLLSPS